VKVALLHFHLRHGGVTSVLRAQTRHLLADQPECTPTILSGEPPAIPTEWAHCPIHHLPELAYQNHPASAHSARSIAAALLEHIRHNHVDILHVHNPLLGKSPHLPEALRILLGHGVPQLWQIHDFAEDGRFELLDRIPDHHHLYPLADHLHYAVLSQRDQSLLQSAGIPVANITILANPLTQPNVTPTPTPTNSRFLFAPIRALPRKNIGELAAWAALLAADGWTIGISQPPTNPAHLEEYQHWKSTARKLHLPLQFDLGTTGPDAFAHHWQQCRAILTTSIQEGFGLAFTEAWLGGRPLLGRILPEATAALRHAGLELASCYRALLIHQSILPGEWTGPSLTRKIAASLQKTTASYPFLAGIDPLQNIENKLHPCPDQNQWIDFGQLPSQLQHQLIDPIRTTPDCCQLLLQDRTIRPACQTFPHLLKSADNHLEANKSLLHQHLDPHTALAPLTKLYQSLANSQPGQLHHANFHPILNATTNNLPIPLWPHRPPSTLEKRPVPAQ